jgi:hypothetical protein
MRWFAMAALTIAAGCGGKQAGSDDAGAGGSSSGTASSGGSASSGSGGSSGGTGSTSGSGGNSGGGTSSETPVNHRTDDAQCQTMPTAGDCTLGGFSNIACTADGQCNLGTNGRCEQSSGNCRCTYDSCMHDSDCGSGKTCVCHGSPYSGTNGNTCSASDCRIDSDCGPNGYCSPAFTPGVCGAVPAYHCHTVADACVNDSDCASQGSNVGCTYLDGRWQCATEPECF